MRHLAAIVAILSVLVAGAAIHALTSDLEDTRRQLAKATADVRHYKNRAYWLEARYEDALQGMRDEHSLDVFRLVEELNSCRKGKS